MRRNALISLAGIALMAVGLAAQEPLRGPDGGTSTRVSGVELLAIPGKPFSAKSSTEWTRTLPDGSTIMTRLEANLARDSRGRIYRERHSFVAANSGRPSPLNEIHIYDPLSRTQALCSIRTMECVLSDYYPRTFFDTPVTGLNSAGTRSLARESIGSDTIEGLYVTGIRETTTINAGVVGNEQPLVSTREFWFSEELQTNLAVTRDDPREGKQVIRLSNLSRAEPDPHIFEIPIGYTVRDTRAPTRHGTTFGRVR
ncbi:MAG: hypothetical protein ABSE87_14670 [Terracidiphilus sp.]|jgi:hypothetical protein